MVIEINSKTCNTCQATLPLSEFYTNKNGIFSRCKQCSIDRNIKNRRTRQAEGYRRPKKRVSLYELHTKLLSGLGPEIELFSGRYVHTYREFFLWRGPWGYILDGELLYGEYDVHDLVHTLHSRHMKLMKRRESGTDLEIVLRDITLLRNSCGVPIDVRFVKSLMLLEQYFLWMDKPRKLLISEVSQQLSLSIEILQFISPPEKTHSNPTQAAPVILKNPATKEPQVIEKTSDDIQFVEE